MRSQGDLFLRTAGQKLRRRPGIEPGDSDVMSHTGPNPTNGPSWSAVQFKLIMGSADLYVQCPVRTV